MDEGSNDRWYRYRRTVGTTLAGPWLVVYVVCSVLVQRTTLADWQRVAISFVPLPFFGLFLWRFVQHMRSSDELERRIQLEALAIAFPLAIALLMTLGLLQRANAVLSAGWSYSSIWTYLVLCYLLGRAIARRRYA
jgi:hypothetical protein